MRRVLQLLSLLAITGVIVPPLVFLAGKLIYEQVDQWMLAATVLWFAVTPFWMNRKSADAAASTA